MIIHFNLDALKNRKSLDARNINLEKHPTPKQCVTHNMHHPNNASPIRCITSTIHNQQMHHPKNVCHPNPQPLNLHCNTAWSLKSRQRTIKGNAPKTTDNHSPCLHPGSSTSPAAPTARNTAPGSTTGRRVEALNPITITNNHVANVRYGWPNCFCHSELVRSGSSRFCPLIGSGSSVYGLIVLACMASCTGSRGKSSMPLRVRMVTVAGVFVVAGAVIVF